MTTPHDPHRDDGLSEDERAFERALAARLQRAGGPREPSAALDAAILAAARAAVGDATVAPAALTPGTAAEGPQAADPPPHAPHPSSDPSAGHGSVVALPPRKPGPRTPRPRWPLGLSLAASLVLAAGIGFKLYDGNLSHDTAESAVAADAYEQQASETVTEAILIDPPLQREPPPPPPPLADAAAQAKVQARRESAELAPTRPRSAAVADAAADAMSAAPQEAPVPSAPPRSSPPPAPVAARRPEPVQPIEAEQQEALDRVEVTGTRVDGARNVGAAEHTRTPLNERRREASEAARAAEAQREAARAESLRRQDSAERRAVVAPPPPPPPPPPMAAPAPAPPSAAARSNAGSGFTADPSADKADAEADDAAGLYDDRPPVSADSPEFRLAWLQRIRKLLADGRRPQAKESLLEYSRRYPEAVIPEDLRPLLAPEPPPPAP